MASGGGHGSCHVLMTTMLDYWDGWQALEVPPLSHEESINLIARIAGREVYSIGMAHNLLRLRAKLPVQMVPASVTLADEARRGRLDAGDHFDEEAQESFLGVSIG